MVVCSLDNRYVRKERGSSLGLTRYETVEKPMAIFNDIHTCVVRGGGGEKG